MSKITQYTQATSFDEGDFLIKDGTNGTKIIAIDDAVDEFSEMSGLDTLKTNFQNLDAGDVAYSDSDTYNSGTVGSKVSDLKSTINNNLPKKVNQPLNGSLQPTHGTNGQVLRTKGDGTTEWASVGLPTDEQTAEAVDAWLDEHPEATTTVQDGSLTKAKLSTDLQTETIKKYITPDMFSGSDDAEKLQAAVDYAIANGLPSIGLEREYDLTGSTIYINKGGRYSDEVSTYSRSKLVFFGLGIGRLKKADTGFMFSATSVSGDISFINVKFIGSASGDTADTANDMTVFDCVHLIRLTVTNCQFTWCGHIFYQSGSAQQTAQTIVSIGNLYNKCKIVAEFQNCYDVRFLGDTIEDNVCFIKSTSLDSASLKFLHITECCIEGHSGAAIEIANITVGANISSNYFEGNRGHVLIPRRFDGLFVGNIFFGRGNIPQSENISCFEFALGESYVIDGNRCNDTNESTTLFVFNTDSPYYNASRKIIGRNTSSGTLTNVSENVISEEILNQFAVSSSSDITSSVDDTYTQITGGTITFIEKNGCKQIVFNNVVLSGAIASGTYTGSASALKPTDNIQHNGVIADQSNNLCAFIYVTATGGLGIRASSAGKYSGQVVYN